MLLSAVMVAASAWGRVCRYCSVVVSRAWPMRSLTAWRSAPPAVGDGTRVLWGVRQQVYASGGRQLAAARSGVGVATLRVGVGQGVSVVFER
jgi:hypothetical protein